MGIQGLLQFIKDASEAISVRKYKGQTVAVDTYCWLHKGAFSCAEKLAKGEPTDQYVMFCMKFVDMLLSFGVKPILVFDGCNLPSKREVEKARRERRQANLQKGKQLLREGKISEARDCFTRCVNVTPAMAHDVIKAARARGVDCVVAPYEADAQLAFLNKAGIAQAIITEDSDLLAFGCKKVILKMDKLGNGLEINQSNLGRCRALGDVFTEEKFRYMCILSGCDYLPSLYGIGLGKACKLLRVASNPDILKVIRKMGQYLKMNVNVSDEYIEGFIKANNTFLYQLVFDPINRKVVPLNPYPDNIDLSSLSYAGHNVGDEKGLQMALGNIDINTMQKIDDYNPDMAQVSIWSKGYTPGGILSSMPSIPDSPEKPSTRGKERLIQVHGLKLPHRELQVKRPREDSSISEDDILQQYSASNLKKQRTEESKPATGEGVGASSGACLEGAPAVTASQPRARNKFATLLQRRNQDDESGDDQCTRSRFFCNTSSRETASPSLEQEESTRPEAEVSHGLAQSGESICVRQDTEAREEEEDETGAHSQDTPSPPSSQASQPPGQGRGAFDWSSSCPERTRTPTPTSGLLTLKRFQRQKDTISWGASSSRDPPHAVSSPPPHQEDKGAKEDSQDSAYFSQPSHTSCTGKSGLCHSPDQDSSAELNTSQESDTSENSSCSPVMEKKPPVIRAKVSGLPRSWSGDLGKGPRIQLSGPARASGLRKKPVGNGKKSGASNENSLGLQATISGLWKNFGFQKETPKIDPAKKGEPMSPVEENISALTPESIKDVYFNPENASVQKAICL
ncbi:hypothetical protein JZ751_011284 [Albula glossodonta]|uniref:Exonuclease 1 n=1 Tax=Albula glossodonta TaxID=121402 RepID=A0A8T2P4S7_9TELE|nr:hypothetical protein JZ751_011284 [Albula glossodonta]